MLWRKTLPVGPLACNCTLLGDSLRKEAIAIDPGDEVPRLQRLLAAAQMRLVAIVHTHAHIDHIGGTEQLRQSGGAVTYLHPADAPLHQALGLQAQLLGLPPPLAGSIDRPLRDGEAVSFGDYALEVLHTPGHSPGSVCFHLAAANLCFSGDTLFAGSIGRTDLWGGDGPLLLRSIRQRLFRLDPACQLLPGHGPASSIGAEQRSNPFVGAACR